MSIRRKAMKKIKSNGMQNKDRRQKKKPFLNQEIPSTGKKSIRINLSFSLPQKKKDPNQCPLLSTTVGIHCLCTVCMIQNVQKRAKGNKKNIMKTNHAEYLSLFNHRHSFTYFYSY